MEAQETITIDLAAYEADRNADHGDAERRIHNLEHALEIAEKDNAALRMRIAELEANVRFWKKGACDLFKELEER